MVSSCALQRYLLRKHDSFFGGAFNGYRIFFRAAVGIFWILHVDCIVRVSTMQIVLNKDIIQCFYEI